MFILTNLTCWWTCLRSTVLILSSCIKIWRWNQARRILLISQTFSKCRQINQGKNNQSLLQHPLLSCQHSRLRYIGCVSVVNTIISRCRFMGQLSLNTVEPAKQTVIPSNYHRTNCVSSATSTYYVRLRNRGSRSTMHSKKLWLHWPMWCQNYQCSL